MAKPIENLLITLDYLLNYTDSKHKLSQRDLVDYAFKNYKIKIDHRSISELLSKLQAYSDQYPDKFPFIIGNDGAKRPKYYIEQKSFSDEDIIAIMIAIKNDPIISNEVGDRLIDSFIEGATSKHRVDYFKKIVRAQPDVSAKFSKTVIKNIEVINKAIQSNCRLKYRSKYDTLEYNDYFYKIVYIDAKPYAIILRDGKLISLKVGSIKILDNRGNELDPINAVKPTRESIEEEIKKAILPNHNKELQDCEFEFENSEYVVDSVKESYKRYFNKELNVDYYGDVCHCSVKCDPTLFIKWCTTFDIAQLIKVTGSDVVRIFLATYVHLLIHKNDLKMFIS